MPDPVMINKHCNLPMQQIPADIIVVRRCPGCVYLNGQVAATTRITLLAGRAARLLASAFFSL